MVVPIRHQVGKLRIVPIQIFAGRGQAPSRRGNALARVREPLALRGQAVQPVEARHLPVTGKRHFAVRGTRSLAAHAEYYRFLENWFCSHGTDAFAEA